MSPIGALEDLGRILVVVPTYNERDNLELLHRRLSAAVPEADMLVVDDASPDGTGRVADMLSSRDGRVHVLHRAGREGLGTAYLSGFRHALGAGYDVVCEMDADGSHQPEELPRLLRALLHADLVLGSRWVAGGEVREWAFGRTVLSRAGNAYARAALDVPLRDATGGFRAYRRATLEKFDLDSVRSQGYCFQIDLAVRVAREGMRVVEVPITFVERTRGSSKMSRRVVAEALWRVTAWGVAHHLARLTGRR
ncbi:MAG: polyprenol monophosphomannose synthase [Streptosporangiaceae bacterium]